MTARFLLLLAKFAAGAACEGLVQGDDCREACQAAAAEGAGRGSVGEDRPQVR